MYLCHVFAGRRLSIRCSTKGAAPCSFRIVPLKSYLGKVLLRDIASIWNNFFRNSISAEYLAMQGYVQGALQKDPLIAPLVDHFKTAASGKSY